MCLSLLLLLCSPAKTLGVAVCRIFDRLVTIQVIVFRLRVRVLADEGYGKKCR